MKSHSIGSEFKGRIEKSGTPTLVYLFSQAFTIFQEVSIFSSRRYGTRIHSNIMQSEVSYWNLLTNRQNFWSWNPLEKESGFKTINQFWDSDFMSSRLIAALPVLPFQKMNWYQPRHRGLRQHISVFFDAYRLDKSFSNPRIQRQWNQMVWKQFLKCKGHSFDSELGEAK